jgi:mRNA-degrading endonuclease RelE of RelBE toxin-antitoxin system
MVAIREAVRGLAQDPFQGHMLVLELTGYRALRVSRYRIIYRVQEDIRTVDVQFVGPRKNVYEAFRTLLEQSLPDRP